MQPRVEALEEKLGYQFRDPQLLLRALTHRSWLSERPSSLPQNGDNEQLEFLGDAVLGFVVSESLVSNHPALREGELSQLKAHLVSAAHLHQCAVPLQLGEYLLLGKGEERNGGRERKTLLANAIEALIAALHLDGGIDVARRFIAAYVLGAFGDPHDLKSIALLNYKSVLNEQAQELGFPPPRYEIVETSGPEHAKVFTAEVTIGERYASRANGSSKKVATQHAAQLLIEQMQAGLERSAKPD